MYFSVWLKFLCLKNSCRYTALRTFLPNIFSLDIKTSALLFLTMVVLYCHFLPHKIYASKNVITLTLSLRMFMK